MSEPLELKKINANAIGPAIEKAEHYRLLNQPEQAESICLDILAIDDDHTRALVILVLSIADQFSQNTSSPGMDKAKQYIARMNDPYQAAYYTGILHERRARAQLGRGMSGAFAYEELRIAMDWFQKAEATRPPGNDEAILRWNACARTIQRENLHPREVEREQFLE